jgi:hypothetical protein
MDDNTNNFSQSILQTNDSFNSSDSSFFGGIANISITTWLLIILILAFLGFNIFVYLAQGTQTIADIFGPLVKQLFGTTLAVTGEVVDVSAEGAKKVVGGTANVIEKGLTAIQDITPNASKFSSPQQSSLNQSLNQSLNTSKKNIYQQDYQANEASSSVHSAGKSGWCYVGNDKGFRTCAHVGENDNCMSGDIFPTQEICMNPNLRV